MSRRITLLTDFGTVDGYAAAMKGVIASIAPDAVVDDASHDVAQGDVEAAGWALSAYWARYPEGSVHVVVVDPGVGTPRRGLAIRVRGRYVVAPDNGVVTRVLLDGELEAAHELLAHEYRLPDTSRTFHGRDIFAPAAAHLASGVDISRLGPAVPDPVRLELSAPVVSDGVVVGRVVHVDRFGNLITDIDRDALPAKDATVTIEGTDVGRVRDTYGDAVAGQPLALIGSSGRLEVAVRDGDAAQRLDCGRGAVVRVQG